MMQGRRIAALSWLIFVSSWGCSDAPLFRPVEEIVEVFDNKLQLEGQVCTTDPAALDFPVKVMFVVDASSSMRVNDPIDPTIADMTRQTGRSRAIADVISQYVDIGIQYPPVYCMTGDPGCAPGEVGCPVCGANAVCLGPDCCQPGSCGVDKPVCPAFGITNGTCVPLCAADSDCLNPGDRCVNGYCAIYFDRGVEFALERFGAAKQILTRNAADEEGFTNDPGKLAAALPQLNSTTGVTDYEGALRTAFRALTADMTAIEQTNSSVLSRTRYVVIFLSDGQPDPQIRSENDWDSVLPAIQDAMLGPNLSPSSINQYNIDTRILKRVQEIRELEFVFGTGDIALHTAYLSATNSPVVQAPAIALLERMADVGGGTFRNFQNGEEINFLHVGFSSLRRVFRLKSFLAANLNGRPDPSGQLTDSDGDGLSDERETLAGSYVTRLDSDGDGFSDALEHFFRSSGSDALDPTDADCVLGGNDADGDGQRDDSDGDGLLDCEERFLGTSKFRFDSDADGIPDAIEVQFGTNPAANDVLNDNLDFDGLPNGDELRLHTDPAVDDAAHRSRHSYRYSVSRTGSGIETMPVTCQANSDCASGRCENRFCACATNNECSSAVACVTDSDCPFMGEQCGPSGQCTSARRCQIVSAVSDTDTICAATENVTCYDYAVENISLVTPLESATQPEGWNNIFLYFGQTPFDSPENEGLFQLACIRANYLDTNGRKNPADGITQVPISAWTDPAQFDPDRDCLCPDGSFGRCF